MRKERIWLAALTLSLGLLGMQAFNLTAQAADLGCSALSDCCNEEHCSGPGTANGCKITCQDETVITCPTKPAKGCGALIE
jgi:hypothetical protein